MRHRNAYFALNRLLPLASVFAPGTLTVQSKVIDPAPLVRMRVPNVDFTSLNFPTMPGVIGATPMYIYSGPQIAVQKVVIATMAEGLILSIASPASNSSWTLDFPGPAIRCDNVGAPLRKEVIQNIEDEACSRNCWDSYGYLAWTPQRNI